MNEIILLSVEILVCFSEGYYFRTRLIELIIPDCVVRGVVENGYWGTHHVCKKLR